jgi:hypothetical protein
VNSNMRRHMRMHAREPPPAPVPVPGHGRDRGYRRDPSVVYVHWTPPAFAGPAGADAGADVYGTEAPHAAGGSPRGRLAAARLMERGRSG